MRCLFLFFLSGIAAISAPPICVAQFPMPLQRVDAFSDDNDDLMLGADFSGNPTFSRTWAGTVWPSVDIDNFTPVFDDDLVLGSVASSVTDVSSQIAAEAFTLTPISSTTTVGDLDSDIIGQSLWGVWIDEFDGGFAYWQMDFSGATEFIVQANTEHDPPEEIVLRANLWAAATNYNSSPFESISGGNISIIVQNVTSGASVSFDAAWNDQTREWEWIYTDQLNGQITGATLEGVNEGFYEEISGVQVGDRIRITVINNMNSWGSGSPGSQLWQTSAGAWFDVIGQ
jgi:hypothetical protein